MYKGNFKFSHSDDWMDEFNDGSTSCKVCGTPCIQDNYFEVDGEKYYDPAELNCSCSEESLRAKLEEEEYIELDVYGQKLMCFFMKFTKDEFIICRMSEKAKATFEQLCEVDKKTLYKLFLEVYYEKKEAEIEAGTFDSLLIR